MALLDKFRQLADAREALARLGEDPFRATIERILFFFQAEDGIRDNER